MEPTNVDTDAAAAIPRWWRWALVVICTVLAGATAVALLADRSGPARVGLIVLSSVLATASIAPTIRATVHGSGEPRLVTWGTWAMLTALAGFASLSAGDYPAAAFSFVGTAATASVTITALRFGSREFDRLDAVCSALVIAGGGLWLTFHQPWVAVIAACVIDCIGLVSTIRHAWRQPDQESTSTYALIAAAGVFAGLAALGTGTSTIFGWITALAYPVYVAVSMGFVAFLTLRRPARTRPVPEFAGT